MNPNHTSLRLVPDSQLCFPRLRAPQTLPGAAFGIASHVPEILERRLATFLANRGRHANVLAGISAKSSVLCALDDTQEPIELFRATLRDGTWDRDHSLLLAISPAQFLEPDTDPELQDVTIGLARAAAEVWNDGTIPHSVNVWRVGRILRPKDEPYHLTSPRALSKSETQAVEALIPLADRQTRAGAYMRLVATEPVTAE